MPVGSVGRWLGRSVARAVGGSGGRSCRPVGRPTGRMLPAVLERPMLSERDARKLPGSCFCTLS